MNSPRRPLEACGTSGMKAVFNATLNCSTLDGWWDEAYDTRNGFAYGDGAVHLDPARQDQHDAEDLHDVLVQRVLPVYYDRGEHSIPFAWLQMVKHALKTLGWRYNADRMVLDYTRRMYIPAAGTQTAHIPE
jgi:starch phosphorylase